MATLADDNATFTGRAEQYRAHAKVLREHAGMVCIATLCHELLRMAKERVELAHNIEGLQFRDD
jgi:hypothetical protein